MCVNSAYIFVGVGIFGTKMGPEALAACMIEMDPDGSGIIVIVWYSCYFIGCFCCCMFIVLLLFALLYYHLLLHYYC